MFCVVLLAGSVAHGQIPPDPFLGPEATLTPVSTVVTSIAGSQTAAGNNVSATFRVETHNFPADVSYVVRIRSYIAGQSGSILVGTQVTDSNTGSFGIGENTILTVSSAITGALVDPINSYVGEGIISAVETSGGGTHDDDFDYVYLEPDGGSI